MSQPQSIDDIRQLLENTIYSSHFDELVELIERYRGRLSDLAPRKPLQSAPLADIICYRLLAFMSPSPTVPPDPSSYVALDMILPYTTLRFIRNWHNQLFDVLRQCNNPFIASRVSDFLTAQLVALELCPPENKNEDT